MKRAGLQLQFRLSLHILCFINCYLQRSNRNILPFGKFLLSLQSIKRHWYDE